MSARAGVAKPHAGWTLLRMHYVRVVVPIAVVALAVLVVLYAGFSIAKARGTPLDVSDFDRLVIGVAGLLAIPTGTAVFSRPFKEQHILLFHALPVSRVRQWALLAASSFLALLTVDAALAMLRPNALGILVHSGTLPIFIAVTTFGFAAGLCFATIFVRPVLVYVSAHLGAIAIAALLIASIWAPQFAYYGFNEMDITDLSRAAPWVAAIVLTIGFAFASAMFYARGEMTIGRVQARNLLIVVAGAAAIALITMPLMYAIEPGRRVAVESRISPDGRHIAQRHESPWARWHSDVTIHDLTSGRSTMFDVPGFRNDQWNDDGELLVWIRDASPLRRLMYLRGPHDRIERWSADGRRLGETVYDGEILEWSREIAVVRKHDVAHVVALQSGRERFTAPAPDDLWLLRDFVVFNWNDRDSRVWTIAADGVHEWPRAPIASDNRQAWAFDGTFYPRRDAMLRTIEETVPAPRTASDRVGYFFTNVGSRIFAVVGDPSASASKLYVLDDATKQWKLISDAIPLAANEMPREGVGFYDTFATTVGFNPSLGCALFVERVDGHLRHRIYDAMQDTTATLFERAPDDTRRLAMHTNPIAGKRSVVVTLDGSSTEIVWRDGRVVSRIPRRAGGRLDALWPDGTQVRDDGRFVTVTDPRGASRRIKLARE